MQHLKRTHKNILMLLHVILSSLRSIGCTATSEILSHHEIHILDEAEIVHRVGYPSPVQRPLGCMLLRWSFFGDYSVSIDRQADILHVNLTKIAVVSTKDRPIA